jgi:hypothetical protein
VPNDEAPWLSWQSKREFFKIEHEEEDYHGADLQGLSIPEVCHAFHLPDFEPGTGGLAKSFILSLASLAPPFWDLISHRERERNRVSRTIRQSASFLHNTYQIFDQNRIFMVTKPVIYFHEAAFLYCSSREKGICRV